MATICPFVKAKFIPIGNRWDISVVNNNHVYGMYC